jgi:hypothetical protein
MAVWWALRARVEVRWRLQGSEVGPGAHVAVMWRLGEVAVFLRIVTNLL